MRNSQWILDFINYELEKCNINKRKEGNYWYSSDCKAIYYDDEINTKFSKYCYEQIYKLYEEAIKNSIPKKSKVIGNIK